MADGAGGPRTVSALGDAGLIRPIGGEATGAWVVMGARVTRTGKSLAADELVVPMRAPGFGGLIDETEAPSTLREIKESNARYRNEPDIRAVRRRLGLDGPPAARGARRLFVSRRDAAKRRVVNEEALVAALGDLGLRWSSPAGCRSPSS